MRAKSSAFLELMLGEELDLVTLVEIPVSADVTLRYAIDTQDRTWNGSTWTATSGGFGELQESAEREIPAMRLILQNVDGVLGPLLHPKTGGTDIRGRRVTLYTLDRRLLDAATPVDAAIEVALFVNDVVWVDRQAVALELGVFPAESIRVPDRTLQGLRCRWIYRGTHCGYVGDLDTCDRTREDCRRHFPDEPLRFGGFPSAADARTLTVL